MAAIKDICGFSYMKLSQAAFTNVHICIASKLIGPVWLIWILTNIILKGKLGQIACMLNEKQWFRSLISVLCSLKVLNCFDPNLVKYDWVKNWLQKCKPTTGFVYIYIRIFLIILKKLTQWLDLSIVDPSLG